MKKSILRIAGFAAVAAFFCVMCGDSGLGKSPNNDGVVDGFTDMFKESDPCAANPSAAGCQGDPCVKNPQSSPSCPGYDMCIANPQSSPSCPGYNLCIANPSAVECQGDPCVANPQSSPSCPGYDMCVANPSAAECQGAPVYYNLAIAVSPVGAGATTPAAGAHQYLSGASVAVTATPASGWTFSRWEGDAAGTNATASVVMSGNKSVTAVFVETSAQITYYRLTTGTSEGGSVSPPTGDYPEGTIVTVTATPADGWVFVRWENSTTETTNPITVEMNSNKSRIAIFVKQTYKITFNANGGTGTVPSAQTVNAGSSITLPSGGGLTRSGYAFGGWNTNTGGTGVNYSAGSSYTVTGNVTLYAKWDAVAPVVEYYCQWGGSTIGCVQLGGAPNAIDPDSENGFTYRKQCETYAYGFSTSPTCAGITVPATEYYCDYGSSAKPNCWMMRNQNAMNPDDPGNTFGQSCAAYGTKITCKGSDRPQDGTCCAH